MPIYTALVDCVLCQDCYTSCQVAGTGECAGPPSTLSGCEVVDGGMNGCNQCQMCSIDGACKMALANCENNADCNAILTTNCPQN